MNRSHSFSIFLLKEGLDASNSLVDEHELVSGVSSPALPAGATLYISDLPPRPPWWKSYLLIHQRLEQVLKGAILFLPVEDRCFAITFGHTHHNLKENTYEYDFGLKVTLNSVDPKKLKSTDTLEPGSARRHRTQTPIETDLTYFDFDRDSAIIKKLTGRVKDEYKHLFRHATGAISLRISTTTKVGGLVSLCNQLLSIYKKDDYRTTFPDLRNIEPVRDPDRMGQLENKLLQAFKDKEINLSLAVPDLINYQDNFNIGFSGVGRGELYTDVSMEHYYEYLQSKGVDLSSVTLEHFRVHKLYLCDDNYTTKDSHSIYKSMLFDTLLDDVGHAYHLCEGNWYRVDSDFIASVRSFLDPHFEPTPSSFVAYRQKQYRMESVYNEAISRNNSTHICLDTTNISIRGQSQIEPCDLYFVESDKAIFYHVKISTRSSELSHLFNQGLSAIELIKSNDEAKAKLKKLISDNLNGNDYSTYTRPIDRDDHKIVYVIATRKNHDQKSANLPLFSRLTLRRTIKSLKLMNVDVSVCFVQDISERTSGYKKPRKTKS